MSNLNFVIFLTFASYFMSGGYLAFILVFWNWFSFVCLFFAIISFLLGRYFSQVWRKEAKKEGSG